MNQINLEHLNLTVTDPDATADLLCKLFGWQIRWAGEAMDGGYTVHVGSQDTYLALYTNSDVQGRTGNGSHIGNLNHFAVQVDKLSEIEQRVVANHLQPFSFQNYPPGERFYFMLPDDIEVEVVSYSSE